MDKRERQRRKTHMTVRFGLERPETLGIVTDVSKGGVHISTNAVFPPGSTVHLQVQLPGGEQLSLQGRVMRAKRVPQILMASMRGGMGIRLDDPPAGWRESLLHGE